MSSVLRCVACTKRIKPHHPHIGVEDLETGQEFSYHAREECQERAGHILERGLTERALSSEAAGIGG